MSENIGACDCCGSSSSTSSTTTGTGEGCCPEVEEDKLFTMRLDNHDSCSCWGEADDTTDAVMTEIDANHFEIDLDFCNGMSFHAEAICDGDGWRLEWELTGAGNCDYSGTSNEVDSCCDENGGFVEFESISGLDPTECCGGGVGEGAWNPVYIKWGEPTCGTSPSSSSSSSTSGTTNSTTSQSTTTGTTGTGTTVTAEGPTGDCNNTETCRWQWNATTELWTKIQDCTTGGGEDGCCPEPPDGVGQTEYNDGDIETAVCGENFPTS